MNEQLRAMMLGTAIGVTATTALAMFVVSPHKYAEPTPIATSTPILPQVTLDCSGSPHLKDSGEVIVVTGWHEDGKTIRVSNNGVSHEVDISGKVCSIDAKIGN